MYAAESLSAAHGRGRVAPAGPSGPSIRRFVPVGACMPRVAFPLLCLALCGCGYSTWSNPPFSSGTNPHFPVGDSENMRRVTGEQVDTPQLTPEPGDIWPGPLPPTPTLQELEQQ